MIKLFSHFRKKNIYDFDNGICLPDIKNQSDNMPLRQIPLASRLIVPLKQHIGTAGELCVKSGDYVLRGQMLTIGNHDSILPVHASTSGRITEISFHKKVCSSIITELSVIIEPDGEDRWVKLKGWNDYYAYSREALIDRINQCGVAGLGGAGFPTNVKLHSSINKIHTLIINATECEPYITADDRLIQDYAIQIVEGILILAYILQPNKILIGIEDNKPQAISMLRAALVGNHNISLRVIPTKYPSGSAKQLTQILIGKQIPHGKHSSDIGVLIQNVSTVFAVKRAIIDGEPLTERIVTVTGRAIPNPCNVWARIGTPVRYLLEQTNFYPDENQIAIMGGPLMGFILPCLDVPVTKVTSCLFVPLASEINTMQEERSCIRCGACADVCPMKLLPQQLYLYSKHQQHNKAKEHNLNDCIECGACAWVCPSNIPLLQHFRKEKAEIYNISIEEKRAIDTKSRFKARHSSLDNYNLADMQLIKSNQNTAIDVTQQLFFDDQKIIMQPIIIATDEKKYSNEKIIEKRKATVKSAIARVKARKAILQQEEINRKKHID